MNYSTKQLAKLAGVSRRTLHYYDEIGLLRPASVGDNSYRSYDDENLLRLQQILFFRELEFKLEEIQAILDAPNFDALHALQTHRTALQRRSQRLGKLIETVDKTILHLQGEIKMSTEDLFADFSEEKQKAYYEEARDKYDPQLVEKSNKVWQGYSQSEKEALKAESAAMYADLVANMNKGHSSTEVQAVVAQWHEQMRVFYEPSVEMLRGLANMYVDDPRFAAFYQKLHPDMPVFFRDAILHYCDQLGR